jgi:anaerobic ribonucleoside-triphosphate reductase
MVHCKSDVATAAAADQILVGSNVKFERIRRITGYLVGTLDRFNDGKAAEERERVKHCSMDSWK